MKLDKSLEPFRAAIEALQRLLHKFDDRGVIIGGMRLVFWENRVLRLISMLCFCFPPWKLPGSFVTCEITEAHPYDLVGRVP